MRKNTRQVNFGGHWNDAPFGIRPFNRIHCKVPELGNSFVYMEGEGEGGAGGGSGGGEGGTGGAGSGAGGDDKTFTQKQVDSMIADNRRKVQEKERGEHSKTLKQLEDLQKSSNLTAEESTSLQKRIDELEGLVLTKEEKAAKDLEDARTKHETDVADALKQGDLWKNRYAESTIDRSLLDAAITHKAYNPDQVRQVLRSQTVLEEVKDSVGRGTGKYASMVKMMVTSEDGKTTTEELVIPEKAVEILKATEKYDNLFLSERSGGTGFRPTAGAGSAGAGGNLTSKQKIAAGLSTLR